MAILLIFFLALKKLSGLHKGRDNPGPKEPQPCLSSSLNQVCSANQVVGPLKSANQQKGSQGYRVVAVENQGWPAMICSFWRLWFDH